MLAMWCAKWIYYYGRVAVLPAMRSSWSTGGKLGSPLAPLTPLIGLSPTREAGDCTSAAARAHDDLHVHVLQLPPSFLRLDRHVFIPSIIT